MLVKIIQSAKQVSLVGLLLTIAYGVLYVDKRFTGTRRKARAAHHFLRDAMRAGAASTQPPTPTQSI